MSRTHVRRRRSVSVATLLLALHLGLPAAARAVLGTEPSVSRPGARTYVVRHGDTLWGIATRLDPARDPRTVVEALAAANGVRDAAIVPGQALQLPAAG